ncbi:MAG: CoA-binding protein, partial [Chromatiales bacterium]|nr:CoA-binding protein [Chromatiales bacterium]
MSLIDLGSLDKLFRPRSIAVLGASSSPTKIGGRPVASLLRNGYEGDVYPINSRSDNIQGLQSYGSILDVPKDVDLAICAVP